MPFLQRRHSLRRADASERAQCTPFRGTLWRACRIPLVSAAMAYKATETPYIIRCIQIICVTTRSTASSRQLRPRMSLSVNDTFALRTPGETSPVGRFVWI